MEWVDYQLMRVMGWSWEDLEATPVYVRRFCWDFACIQAQHEQDEVDQARRDAERDRIRAGG